MYSCRNEGKITFSLQNAAIAYSHTNAHARIHILKLFGLSSVINAKLWQERTQNWQNQYVYIYRPYTRYAQLYWGGMAESTLDIIL